MKTLSLLLFAAIACCTSPVIAQIDPYTRITDPRGIARLDLEDSALLENQGYVDNIVVPDPYDSSHIIASGDGPGIITHIWTTTNNGLIDTNSVLRLWVDDSLVVSAKTGYFFTQPHGLMRAPLSLDLSGGFITDVQIPFHKNFRLTHKGPFLAWKVAWRPVPAGATLGSFAQPDAALIASQTKAEAAYENTGSPWKDASELIQFGQTLQPGDTLVLADLVGPGMIKTMHFERILDRKSLQGVRLQVFWDRSSRASIDVPLGDFFGAGAGVKSVHAFQVHTDSVNGLTCYFPMPFYDHALVRVVGLQPSSQTIQGFIEWDNEPVDRSRQGYFGAQFNEDVVARHHVLHDVLHVKGSGKFIGMFLMMPDSLRPNYMEGDPDLRVDSDDVIRRSAGSVGTTYSIQYAGTEDYCDGGWYFIDGPRSTPFGGSAENWSCLYRFHYLDDVSFNNSFDFKWEHGNGNDYRCHVRSVGYYYVRSTPFWSDRDTIVAGQPLTISGSGYQNGAAITVQLGAGTIATTTADSSGFFRATWMSTLSTTTGVHVLRVNGVERPERLYIAPRPFVVFPTDSAGMIYAWRDSIEVHGYGFTPNEAVAFALDSTPAPTLGSVVADQDGQCVARVFIPWVSAGTHRLSAVGSGGSHVVADSSVVVTRSIQYEFEDLGPVTVADGSPLIFDYLGWNEHSQFGNQEFVFMFNGHLGSRLGFNFNVPFSDTFYLDMYLVTGERYGDYEVFLDGTSTGVFHGIRASDYGNFIRSPAYHAGLQPLTAGRHNLLFVCTSLDPVTTEGSIAADEFYLTPRWAGGPLAVGSKASVSKSNCVIYPNPARSTAGTITMYGFDAQSSARPIEVTILDELGRSVRESTELLDRSGSVKVAIDGLRTGMYQVIARRQNATIRSSRFVLIH